jgi:cytochrome c553
MRPVAFGTLVMTVAACAGGRPNGLPRADAGSDVSIADGGDDAAHPAKRAEDVWLDSIGRGPAQTARVCARGARDPVAARLCTTPGPRLGSLADLHRTLSLVDPPVPGSHRFVAATAGSLGLAARTVSGLNPRVFVGLVSDKAAPEPEIIVTAFARGEQLAEMVVYDGQSRDLNFYLLRFEQPCNATRCTPADLLSEKVEESWSSWTLYGAEDLTNTGLDCLSCHNPEGPGTRRRFLMRQVSDPWMQWTGGLTDDRQVLIECPDQSFVEVVPPDLAAPLAAIAGAAGRYGGLSIDQIRRSPSGHELASFITIAAVQMGYPTNDAPVLEPHPFPSRAVLQDRHCLGSGRPTWQAYRSAMFGRALLSPYHDFDVLDPGRTAEATADHAGFLRARSESDPLLVAAALLKDDAAQAIGFIPSPESSDDQILRQMCGRCHEARTDRTLSRSRFDVDALAALPAAAIEEAIRRVTLPRNSPALMPPLRAGELPPWALTRVVGRLQAVRGR